MGVIGSNQEVFTNAEGRYSITGLNPGRYQVRFVDPALESYGFVPDPVARDVIRGEMTTLDHHMPSVSDVLFDACRGQSRPENSAVLLGRVRDALMRPLAGATVRVLWMDYHLRTVNRLVLFGGDSSGLETTSDAEGFYMFCQVPTDVPLEVQGVLDDERSEVYPLRVGLDLRAELLGIDIIYRD